MSEKIIPFGDNVVIELIEQTKMGSIIIPDKAKNNQRDAIIGKVVAVGKGRTSEAGTLIVPSAKEGDYVLLGRGAGVEVELDIRAKDRRRVRILRDVELLGSVEKSHILLLGLDGSVS